MIEHVRDGKDGQHDLPTKRVRGEAALGVAYYVAYNLARYVAVEAFAYEFVRHEHTRDLNHCHPCSLYRQAWFRP
jgi:hypothetical protein